MVVYKESRMANLRSSKLILWVVTSSVILYIYRSHRIHSPSVYPLPPKTSKMPLKVIDANLSNFATLFEQFKSEAPNYKSNLILFLADKDPSTNLSWCPDCVRAEPVIYKKLESSSDEIALLRTYVGDRASWRNPQNPLRIDPRFKLTGVPTLVSWKNDAIKGRLEDNEAHLEHKIQSLLSGE